MFREGKAHFTLRQRDVRRRPAEDPLGILGRNVDAPMRAFFAKGIMPERTVDGDAVTTDHGIPWNCRRGVPGLERPRGHIQGVDLPMGQQVAHRCGKFVIEFTGRRINLIFQAAGYAAEIDLVRAFETGECLIIQIGFDPLFVRIYIRADRSYFLFGQDLECGSISPE